MIYKIVFAIILHSNFAHKVIVGHVNVQFGDHIHMLPCEEAFFEADAIFVMHLKRNIISFLCYAK